MEYFATELFFEEEMKTNEADMVPLLARCGCGLELISFSIAEKLDAFDTTLREMQGVLERLGNPPLTIHGPFLDLNPMAYDRLVQQATFDRFAQAYEAAEILGARKIIFHSGMVPTVYFLWGWAERMADFWNRFLEKRSGIPVCMENVLDREFGPFAEVADAVDSPDFGICLDTGHAHCYSDDGALAWAKGLAPYIRHMHIHDNDGTRDAHRPCVAGTVPNREILTYLLGQDENGAPRAPKLSSIAVEQLSIEDAEASLRFVREIVG